MLTASDVRVKLRYPESAQWATWEEFLPRREVTAHPTIRSHSRLLAHGCVLVATPTQHSSAGAAVSQVTTGRVRFPDPAVLAATLEQVSHIPPAHSPTSEHKLPTRNF